MTTNTTLFVHKLKAMILDMDGVLWRGSSPIGNLQENFHKIKDLGLGVIMATNNATRNPHQYVDKLASFGVSVEPWQIINSGMATIHYLKIKYPQGGNIFVIGDKALVETLEGSGYPHSEDEPIAVVSAMDRGITYENLKKAALLIEKGIPFIGTNPDKSFPIPEGQAPGAGAILAALEATTGISPLIMGKPQPRMYIQALERLGTSPGETLVVGDRLETDIAGAQNAGCPSAMVLSGVTNLDAAKSWDPEPNLIARDLSAVLEIIDQRTG